MIVSAPPQIQIGHVLGEQGRMAMLSAFIRGVSLHVLGSRTYLCINNSRMQGKGFGQNIYSSLTPLGGLSFLIRWFHN